MKRGIFSLKLILFGAGEFGKKAIKFYGSDSVECYADNDLLKADTVFCGKKVIGFDKLTEIYSEFDVVISMDRISALQVSAQLDEAGISHYIWSPLTKSLDLNMLKSIPKIFAKMSDDISRIIFECRIMRFITDEPAYIIKMVRSLHPQFDLLLSRLGNRRLFLCGTSSFEISFAALNRDNMYGYVDIDNSHNMRNGGDLQIQGLPFYSLSYACNCSSGIFMLPFVDKAKHRLVSDELKKMSIPESQIFDPMPYYRLDEAYFDLPQMQAVKDEVFVDAGAYDGETTKQFIKWANNQCADIRKIYAFEPDKDLYNICKAELNDIPCAYIENMGLWNTSDTLSFQVRPDGASTVSESGDDFIRVVSLDEHLGDERVTFIKMDIEGAEVNALKGAREIIKKYKPKLAISIYHNHEDIITIPVTIHKINPSYRFYIRHYTLGTADSVLYAL